MDSSAPTVTLTNADKVLYPATGTTKADVFDYCTAIAPVMVPHIAGRLVTRKRWPNGAERSEFFEKQLACRLRRGLERGTVVHKSGTTTYPVIDSVAGLAGSPSRRLWKFMCRKWRFVSASRARPTGWCSIWDPGDDVTMSQLCEVACAARDPR